MPRRHRDFVLPLLQSWVEHNGCCPPQAPEGAVTSAARRWSLHTGVAMRRSTPHPRPWEGPRMDFGGLFMGIDRETQPLTFVDVVRDPDELREAMREHLDRVLRDNLIVTDRVAPDVVNISLIRRQSGEDRRGS